MSYIIHKNTSSTTRLQNTYSCLLKNIVTASATEGGHKNSLRKMRIDYDLLTNEGKKLVMLIFSFRIQFCS